MRIVIIGKKTISCNIARLLKKHIILVIGEKDVIWQESLKATSKQLGLNYTTNWDNIKELKEIDYIISAQPERIFTEEDLKIPRYGIINVHFGKVPEYRGCNIIYHVIKNGEKKAYITLFFIDKGVDTGDIISEASIDIKGKTARQVFDELTDTGTELFRNIIRSMEKGNLLRRKQTGKANYYHKNDVNFKEEMEKLKRMELALSFPPFQDVNTIKGNRD